MGVGGVRGDEVDRGETQAEQVARVVARMEGKVRWTDAPGQGGVGHARPKVSGAFTQEVRQLLLTAPPFGGGVDVENAQADLGRTKVAWAEIRPPRA